MKHTLEGLKVTFREFLLDEQLLQNFINVQNNGLDDMIDMMMDYHGGVHNIYFLRGNMHILACKKEYTNEVIIGMLGVIDYMETSLVYDDELALFWLGPWNWPKVGAVHIYRTPVGMIFKPTDIDLFLHLKDFLEDEETGMTFDPQQILDKQPKAALYRGRA